jgi:dTDP-4-amino-4,6-dideoxygalactose transaminase
MRDSFLVFGSPLIGEEEIAEVVDSLRSGWIGTGPKVHCFEQMLAEYVGAGYCRCLSSCTAALILSLQVLGIGPGDEVLVPAMTFVASANAVEHAGATPVLVDCEPGTGLIDLDLAEAAITPRTRAIMPVHLAGRPVDMDRLDALRERHGLHVIEDAAHAIGAEWRGRKIGAFGNLAAFSFYVTKNISTIEGGALVTEDPDVAATVERLALHGLSIGAWQRFSDSGTPRGASRHQGRSLHPVGALLSKVPYRGGESTFVAAPMFHGLGFSQVLKRSLRELCATA